MSWREGSSSASIPTRPCASGWRLEVQPERLEPADDVLRRIGAVDPQNHPLAAKLLELAARRRAPRRSPTSSSNSRGVDGDRMRGDERQVDLRPSTVATDSRKLSRQRCVWKPTTSFASSPSWIAARRPGGQPAPRLRRRPRDVDEVRERRVRPRRRGRPRREVEVVVVEPDRRVRVVVELLEHRGSDRLVHPPVALPRLVERRVVQSSQRSCWRNQSAGWRTRCRSDRSRRGRARRAATGTRPVATGLVERIRRPRRRPRGPRRSARSRSR